MSASTSSRPPAVAVVSIVIVAVVIGLIGLKLAAAVFVPVSFALFLTGVTWPLQKRLLPRVGKGLATLISVLAVLGFMALLIGGLWLTGSHIAAVADDNLPVWSEMVDRGRALAEQSPIPFSGSDVSIGSLKGVVLTAVAGLTSTLGQAALIAGFLVLFLDEGASWLRAGTNLWGEPADGGGPLAGVVDEVTSQLLRYVLIRTALGAGTGVLVTLATWALGLHMPLVWGFATFLLNYIPNIGSLSATILPTLFAAAQFQEVGMTLAVLGAVGAIQLGLGIYVDPLLQGWALSIAPFMVLLSVLFWGFMWGIPGALLGVPISIVLVVVLRRFETTRFLARLMTGP